MLIIDGGRKSGSGTIVRDVVPFAILTGEPVRLIHIRARREPPGLRPQHAKAIEAAARLNGGHLSGAHTDSREITFIPGKGIAGGKFAWDIGTAGSTTMMALSLLPLALFADAPSEYRIKGGLFQDFAPSAFHVAHVLLPMLGLTGAQVHLEILRPGYVPRGNGEILVRATPLNAPLRPFHLTDPGRVTAIRGVSLASHLEERQVADRMAGACREATKADGLEPEFDILHDSTTTPVFARPSVQSGAVLAVWAETDTGCRIGADMAGARGRPAERIGHKVAADLSDDLASGAAVDRHLADQLIPYAALAEGTSTIRVPRITDHVEARLWLAEDLLGAKTRIEGNRITIEGIGYRRKA